MSARPKSIWLSRLDYIFLLRPMLFFPGWSTMLAGFFISTSDYWFPLPDQNVDYLIIFLLISGFAMIMGSAFVLNQLRDIESDKKNNKLFIISDGIVSVTSARREVYILTIAAVIIGFYLNFYIGTLFILFFLITGILYNYKPAKMKDRPWGSLIANALMGWLAFSIGWSINYQPDLHLVIDSFPYFCFNTALYLFTLLPDVKGDKVAGKETLAVVYGIKKIVLWAFILYVFGLIVTVIVKDYQALLFYLLSLPFFMKSIITKKVPDAIRTTKFGILFFALSICLRWPFYLLLMISGFFLTRWYFKQRFDFEYPNFAGK
jgi:4-hydroxybenzoate polyprenyltransferase